MEGEDIMPRYAVRVAIVTEIEGEIEVFADSLEDAQLIVEWMEDQGELQEGNCLYGTEQVNREIEVLSAEELPETRSEEVQRQYR